MHRRPMAKLWIGIVLVAVLFGVVIIQAELQDGPALSEKPDTKVQTSEIPENTKIEQAAEAPGKGVEKEGLQETVSEILDSALGFFSKDDLDIVAIGDSLTQGVGDELKNGGYVGILRETLNEGERSAEITNYGKRGNRTDQLIKRLKKPEISESVEKADLILVTIGANDIMKVVKNNFSNLQYKQFEEEQESYEERLRKIFDIMQEKNPGAEIYMVGFYNPFESYFPDVEALTKIIHNWNSTSRQVTEEYENIHYIPVNDLFKAGEHRYFAEDNFHPNKLGYRLMAGRIFDYIRPSIEAVEKEKEAE